MQSTNYAFVEAFRVPEAEIWHVKNNHSNGKGLSYLEVLYSKTLKLFILRVGSIKILLEKDFPVITSVNSHDKTHAYVFPLSGGEYYILRIGETKPSPALTNFETVLENTTQLIRKSGMERKLEPLTGGKYAGAKFTPAGSGDPNPNHRFVRPFEEIIDIENTGAKLVDLPVGEVESMRDEAGEIMRNHLETPLWKEFSEWGGISGSTDTEEQQLPRGYDNVTELGRSIKKSMGVGEKDLGIPDVHIDLGNPVSDLSGNVLPSEEKSTKVEEDRQVWAGDFHPINMTISEEIPQKKDNNYTDLGRSIDKALGSGEKDLKIPNVEGDCGVSLRELEEVSAINIAREQKLEKINDNFTELGGPFDRATGRGEKDLGIPNVEGDRGVNLEDLSGTS